MQPKYLPVNPNENNEPSAPPMEPERRTSQAEKFMCIEGKTLGELLDLVSATLSLGALLWLMVIIFSAKQNEYDAKISDANTLTGPVNSRLYDIMLPASTIDVSETCGAPQVSKSWFRRLLIFPFFMLNPSSTSYKQSVDKMSYDKVVYTGITIFTEAGSYNPMYLLLFIFLVSIGCQYGRYRLYVAEGSKSGNNNEGGTQYRPYAGPEFWRWVEYALTAPLQIVIISSTFGVSDRSLLLALGGTQGGLMLLGFSLEQQIRKYSKYRNKDPTSRRNRHQGLKLFYLLWSAWALHSIVWYVLLDRYYRQVENIVSCKLPGEMPEFVNFIVIGEFILFSLFGLVPTIQCIYIYYRKPQEASVVKVADSRMWDLVSVVYGVLSVVAKTLLEYGFLGLLSNIPQTVQ